MPRPDCQRLKQSAPPSLSPAPFQSRREAGETAAIVLLVKLRVFRNRPGEEPLAKRTERNKADAKFFERGNDFLFRALPPERVFTLKRRHWLNCVCPADGLCPRFR